MAIHDDNPQPTPVNPPTPTPTPAPAPAPEPPRTFQTDPTQERFQQPGIMGQSPQGQQGPGQAGGWQQVPPQQQPQRGNWNPQGNQAPPNWSRQGQPSQQTPIDYSVHNPSVISSQPAGENIKSFIETITEMAKSARSNYKLTIIPLYKAEADLFANGVIIAVRLAEGETNLVAYHTLILADSAMQPPPIQQSINGRPVSILAVVGDCYDDLYKQAILRAVQKTFPQIDPANLLNAEAEVIPRDYDYRNQQLILKTLANATTACGTILNSNQNNQVEFTIAQYGNQLNSSVRLSFDQPQIHDAVGEPRRADVTIEFIQNNRSPNLYQSQYDNATQSLNGRQQMTQVFKISGFMDLLWNPANAQTTQNPYLQIQSPSTIQSTQLYSARYVITELDPLVLKTLPEQLLGLATVLTLKENSNWVGAFSRKSGAGFRIHDIGAIGYEVPTIRDQINTSADSFKMENFFQLMQAFVWPRPIISMDVPEVGPDTWFNSVFLAAAMGSTEANTMILSAADVLTSGRFSQEYRGPNYVCINDNSRIHNGWFLDKDRIPTDIRSIDYLAVLNLMARKNPSMARDWSDTFAYTQWPQELRLATRKTIIEECVMSNDIRWSGFSRRISFRHDFIEALARAIVAAGLTIRPLVANEDLNNLSAQPRGSASWLNEAQLSIDPTGLFNRSTGQQAAVGPNPYSTFGRWNR